MFLNVFTWAEVVFLVDFLKNGLSVNLLVDDDWWRGDISLAFLTAAAPQSSHSFFTSIFQSHWNWKHMGWHHIKYQEAKIVSKNLLHQLRGTQHSHPFYKLENDPSCCILINPIPSRGTTLRRCFFKAYGAIQRVGNFKARALLYKVAEIIAYIVIKSYKIILRGRHIWLKDLSSLTRFYWNFQIGT